MDKNKKLWRIFLVIPFGIAVITCFIVDYALTGRFTWSFIVAGGCIFGYLLLYMLLFGGKHRIVLAFATICILVIPYLYIIESISNLYVSKPVYWAARLGTPLCICWLTACGILMLIQKFTHANVWLMSGVAVLTFYAAERYTSYKVDVFESAGTNVWRLSEQYPVIYFGSAAILIFIGVIIMAFKHVGHRISEN